MQFRFGLDDKPSIGAMLLYGLQWLMICIPVVLTSTFVAPEGEMVFFTQKLFAVCGAAIIIQVLWGHRLPLVAGPAAVLLMGVIAAHSQGHDASTIYPSMIVGGALVTLLAAVGAMKYIQRIFTPRIVAAIVVLISFTMAKPIVGLIFADKAHAGLALVATIVGIALMAWANKAFRGIWKSAVVIIAMVLGSLFYYCVTGFPKSFVSDSVAPHLFLDEYHLDAGVILAFLFCYIALLINQIGSVQSLGQMVGASEMERRQKRGLLATGLFNIACGATGVLGVVDYSLSPGVVASTSCASRYTILPAAVAMIVLSLFPQVVAALLTIPQPIMGIVLLFLMATQVAAGLEIIHSSKAVLSFRDGLVLGIPIMVTIILSFAPAEAMAAVPSLLRPIVGNGFVMGIIVVLILEHLVLREKRSAKES
ncbi:MAG: purine/pyrimidine permease [Alistipes sp.]|nr:purine/pyrimidine permease [Alistipes sp.]